ncbi:MAG: hypothetical protein ACOC1D_04520 [Prolixibacteraceae bacterium]
MNSELLKCSLRSEKYKEMELKEAKKILQRYFDGETTLEEERKLEDYFRSENVADELKQYSGFFGGISELAEVSGEATIEEDVMDHILENEQKEKSKYRQLWRTVTGIAASVILILGGFLLWEQQQKPYEDTFENPEVAYAYAQQTMKYVGAKYNKGVEELSNFNKLETATEPLEKGIEPVCRFLNGVKQMSSEQ